MTGPQPRCNCPADNAAVNDGVGGQVITVTVWVQVELLAQQSVALQIRKTTLEQGYELVRVSTA